MIVRIGTSGWQYDDWRRRVYPADLPKTAWLEYYASKFATVEINSAFYRLPSAETFTQWARRTPDDFLFAVKASRFLSHIKRLREPEEPVARLVNRCRHLDTKFGPVLLQLAPTHQIDFPALRQTLSAFPRDVRLAVELRHQSWFTDDVEALLAEHDAALCLADSAERTTPRWQTASFSYIRFHGRTGAFPPCYSIAQLNDWARWLATSLPSGQEVFVYFNNDPGGCAIRDAAQFALEAVRYGLETTRVDPTLVARVDASLEKAESL